MTTNEIAETEHEIVQDYQVKEKIVNEEFKIWKKTVPLLYDTIHSYTLDSSSLVFQWLPNYTYSESKETISLSYVIGTNSSDSSQNFLKLGSLDLPSTLAPDFAKEVPNVQNIPIPPVSVEDSSNFRITTKWKQSGVINELKVSEDGVNVLTFNSDGVIHCYNLENNDVFNYKYHKLEGSALEWVKPDFFLSGSKDYQIAYWNSTKPSTPIQLFKTHKGAINDLSSNPNVRDIFGSVSDDYTTQFYDLRVAGSSENPVLSHTNNHIQYAIDFHPDIETLYATAGKDNTVNLYDIRNHNVPIRRFFGHNDTVLGLQWDDTNGLISWGLDKRVILWDLSSLDDEFVYPSESIDNSKKKTSSRVDPCLRFIHAGHTNRVNDVGIHPRLKNIYGTVGEDQLFEVWKPKTLLTEEEEEEEEEEEKEEEGKEEKEENEEMEEKEDPHQEQDKDEEQVKEEVQEPVKEPVKEPEQVAEKDEKEDDKINDVKANESNTEANDVEMDE